MTAKTEGQETWRQGNLNMVADHQVLFRLKVDKPKDKEVRSRFPITKVDEDWRSRNLKRVTKTGSLLLLTMKSDQGFRQWSRLKTEGQETWRQGKLNKVADHQVWSRLKGNKPEKKEVRWGFPFAKVGEDWRSSNLNRVTNQVCFRRNDRKSDVADQEVWSRPKVKELEQG